MLMYVTKYSDFGVFVPAKIVYLVPKASVVCLTIENFRLVGLQCQI